MTSKHRTYREGDENVCSCGLRWDVGEEDPHTVSEPVASGRETLDKLHDLFNEQSPQ